MKPNYVVYNNCKSDTWVPRNLISPRDWYIRKVTRMNRKNKGNTNFNYYGNYDHSETIILTKTIILTILYTEKVIKIYQDVNLLT